MFTRIALSASLAFACSAQALAGTYIETSRTDLLNPLRPPETQKLWFDGGNFRLENETGDAVEIFTHRTLYLVEPLRRRFAAFEVASLGLLRAKATALRPRQGSAQASGDNAAPPDSRVAHETSRTESSGGRKCTVWEITVNGVKVSELCVIPADSVPGGAQILADMRQVGAAIDDVGLGETLRGSVADSWSDLDRVDGIPIVSRSFKNGHVAVEIQITAVRTDAIPFTAFVVPAGFRREKLDHRGRT
jgi:hypothetical protein